MASFTVSVPPAIEARVVGYLGTAAGVVTASQGNLPNIEAAALTLGGLIVAAVAHLVAALGKRSAPSA